MRASILSSAPEPKQLHWVETSNHVELYDQAPFVPEAVGTLVEWLGTHLQHGVRHRSKLTSNDDDSSGV